MTEMKSFPVDLSEAIRVLAERRPIFASEADFQLALAWERQLAHPAARLRLEYRPAYLDRRGYLDVWIADEPWAAAIKLGIGMLATTMSSWC